MVLHGHINLGASRAFTEGTPRLFLCEHDLLDYTDNSSALNVTPR